MIRFAADRNFFVELFTNGVLLDKPTAQMLVRAGTSKVNISIDALDPATYFDLRGTDLAPVLNNVRHLAKAKEEAQSITPYIVIAAADLRSN
jgi:MoaA/NifB/PqqE/SkfB family radical SAM enzyme